MEQSRRGFLKRAGCMLAGGAALASKIESFSLINALAQTGPASDYKALVCIFLHGGNDSNNMIIPYDDHETYRSIRTASDGTTLAVPKTNLDPTVITPANVGRNYALHPSMATLHPLFAQQKLALLCNVGPLVEPLTRTTFTNGSGKRPFQLFSHSDQVSQWYTALSSDNSQTGWGGRLADRAISMNGAATFPQVISISGINLFVTGINARPLAISDARTALSNVLPLSNPPGFNTAQTTARRTAFDQIRTMYHESALVRATGDTTSAALQTSQALASASAALVVDFPNTNLGYQLEQVARLIKLRDTLGMKRQIFFCSIGGFDTHNNQGVMTGTHPGLLDQVARAMKAFYDATVEIGVESQVTTFTLSDFGRTFKPAGTGAGVGSDHGWGSHQLIMGGAVRGGNFFGTFPNLTLGGPDDSGSNGRWIPTTSVEQYAATLAAWYGLPASEIPNVFPLIGRFPTSNLGFMI